MTAGEDWYVCVSKTGRAYVGDRYSVLKWADMNGFKLSDCTIYDLKDVVSEGVAAIQAKDNVKE